MARGKGAGTRSLTVTGLTQNAGPSRPLQKSSTPSAYSMFDSTRYYKNREAYNMPRSVTERFESTAVSNLAKKSLTNPDVKKEYARIQERIEAGIYPVNIRKKSTFVSADKVLIKGARGRYSWFYLPWE